MQKKNLYMGITLFSGIGLWFLLFADFAGFYLTGYYSGYRYSCLTCEYGTAGDITAQIIAIILLIVQLIIGMNGLMSTPYLQKNMEKFIPSLGILTVLVIIIGGIAFAVTHTEYEWWFEAGFYGGLVAGIMNTICGVWIKKQNKTL